MLKRAVAWVRTNALDERCVPISHRNRAPYPEVTGYWIPTLLQVGERQLAENFARYLVSIQNADGSFSLDSQETFVFDTGQIIRGWAAIAPTMPEVMQPMRRACEWIVGGADPRTGKFKAPPPGNMWSLGKRGEVNEGVHTFVIRPLRDAATLLDAPHIRQAADRALQAYIDTLELTNFERPEALTHLYAYIQEALVETGHRDLAAIGMANAARYQIGTGAVPAYYDVPWVCSTGLAQLARVWFMLGDRPRGEAALNFVRSIQNHTGGFYGSYGPLAEYFPGDEIAWVPKFAIDAELAAAGQFFLPVDAQATQSAPTPAADQPTPMPKGAPAMPSQTLPSAGKTLDANLAPDEWNESITRGTSPATVAHKVAGGAAPPLWIEPILADTAAGDTVLELGSGTGEMSAHLARHGRITSLFDFSQDSLRFASEVYTRLDLRGQFIEGDVLKRLPFDDHAIDVVWSSGLLEHFTENEIAAMIVESARVAGKRVISLVPNASSLAYRLGKAAQERSGRWIWGKETPKTSLEQVFRDAGLTRIREYSIAPEHALSFLDAPEFVALRTEMARAFAATAAETLKTFNQGYLLVTVGEVDAQLKRD